MGSSWFIVGRHFLPLHRHWLLAFGGLELAFLVVVTWTGQAIDLPLVGSAGEWQTSGWKSRLAFVLAGTGVASLLQVALGIHLGITFSTRNPDAWAIRMPLPRAGPSGFAVSLVCANGLVLGMALLNAWTDLYEASAYPAAFALLLAPCVAFQVARRQRGPAPAVAAGLASGLAAGLLGLNVRFLLPDGFLASDPSVFFELRPAVLQALVAGLCLLVTFLADPDRRGLRITLLCIALGLAAVSGRAAFEADDYRDSHFRAQVRDLHDRSATSAQACVSRSRAWRDWMARHPDATETQRLESREFILLMLDHFRSQASLSVAGTDIHWHWMKLSWQPILRPAFRSLVSVERCSPEETRRHFQEVARGIAGSGEIGAVERQRLIRELLSFAATYVASAWSSSELEAGLHMTRDLVREHLVDGIALGDIALPEDDDAARRRQASEDDEGLLQAFPFATDARIRRAAARIIERDVQALRPQRRQALDLLQRARIRSASDGLPPGQGESASKRSKPV